MKPHKRDEVEIVHRINRLKNKVCDPANQHKSGCINPADIKRAEAVIETSHSDYRMALSKALDDLEKAWAKTGQAVSEEEIESLLNKLHRFSNFIKDIASTYGYELMSYFGQSLRDMTYRIDIHNKAHRTIVHAHIDVMRVALHKNISSDKGAFAQELRQALEKAISKYSLLEEEQAAQ